MDDEYRRSEILLTQDVINELVSKYGMDAVTIAGAIKTSQESIHAWRRGDRCPQPGWRQKLLLLLEEINATGIVPKARTKWRR